MTKPWPIWPAEEGTMTTQNLSEVYGRTLVQLGRENPAIVSLEADLGKSTMSCLFEDAHPERHFEMSIAEQNMMSFAAGLALTGKVPFVNSFAVFATGRTYDQIRTSVSILSLNVNVVGTCAGLSDFGDGSTHQAIEDVAIMRAIPNMTIVEPCDGNEMAKAVRAIAAHPGPVYLRINRNDWPDVTSPLREFKIGEAYEIREGSDAVIFAAGAMVHRALEVADTLAGEGISLRVVNCPTLKPLADEDLRALSDGCRALVAAEEHTLIGGLSAIVAYAFKGDGRPLECVGIGDTFGQSAAVYADLVAHYKLTADDVAAAVRKSLAAAG